MRLFKTLQLSFIKRPLLALFALCLSVGIHEHVHAHPHSWIELKTTIEGENGMINGLTMEWSFDAMTSAYVLDGEDISPERIDETFQNIAASLMDNILYEHYFTYFYDGETPIRYGVGHSEKLERDRAKLVLSYYLPLAKPQPVTRDSLRLMIYDKTHFVDMSWRADRHVSLSNDLARQCSLNIVEPNPTPEQMSYAMSLPEDADPDNTLGELFTQTAEIHCASMP
ncbi:DUF1007 family protein [Vibrio astriarenae]|uniref:DUF1007 family protein n=1 Tax=Vibrio astriarenae TaxID=1481923 RepID=A0A7Z2T623_9VIBR|nr:DUF1007 family protein [Vibrio astriarenae]QIA64971.1 DUF1007 family protein [Vibrio astriarenae]